MIRATTLPRLRFCYQALNLRRTSLRAAKMSAEEPAVSIGDDFRDMTETLQLHALRVPKRKCQDLMKRLSGHTFDKPRLRCVVDDGDRQDTKLLLLSETIVDLASQPKVQEIIETERLEVAPYQITLKFVHFSTDQILKKLLPEGLEFQTSFETIGHIAHVNLRADCLPYKRLIGEVILAKNPYIKTVVNKIGSIDNEYRVFDMEVVAGEQQLETEVVQHGTKFRMDFSKVYWNSRLETEHKRLVQGFSPRDAVVDMMAGIGPFAIPAAQQGCLVYANDLNPWSVHYLRCNAKLNRVNARLHCFNMDARALLRMLLGREPAHPQGEGEAPSSSISQPVASSLPPNMRALPEAWSLPAGGVRFQHVVMNLPASAVEFLDAFGGVFDPAVWRGCLPTIHCYTFKRAAETDEDIRARVEHHLGGTLDAAPTIHLVRDVAPGKLMLCVSFPLPERVAFRTPQGAEAAPSGSHGLEEAPGQRDGLCESSIPGSCENSVPASDVRPREHCIDAVAASVQQPAGPQEGLAAPGSTKHVAKRRRIDGEDEGVISV